MKQCNWSARPYTPFRELDRGDKPYICRVAPSGDSITLEWFDNSSDGEHYLELRRTDATEWKRRPIAGAVVTADKLEPECEYAFRVVRSDGSAVGRERLAYTCEVDGTVVNYNHPEDDFYGYSGRYLSSPGILKLPSGRLLISHDIFGSGSNQGLTLLFTSEDGGESWRFLTEIYPLFWAKFFVHDGKLYTLGVLRQYGDLAISVSEDEGLTWREPVTLIRGDNGEFEGIHQNATPVIICDGRIYTGFECGSWGLQSDVSYGHMLLSARVTDDLLDRASWEVTPPAFFNPANAELPTSQFITAIEGNAVIGPDGCVYDILRMDPVGCDRSKPINKAVLTRLVDFDKPLEFVSVITPAVGIRHKFYTRRDEQTGLYFMVHNEETERNIGRRSIISLSVSSDLIEWRKLTTLLDTTPIPRTGVSYPSFIIDGDDLLYVSRSAFGKLKNEHDNNYVTFHRLKNFRNLL